MLACARIGAIHSVIFTGFSAQALAHRIDDAQCKILLAQGKVFSTKVLPVPDPDYKLPSIFRLHHERWT